MMMTKGDTNKSKYKLNGYPWVNPLDLMIKNQVAGHRHGKEDFH
jgi:hypothetical protein